MFLDDALPVNPVPIGGIETPISHSRVRLTMPEEFDPYSQWLGIAATERPVDHYRLLDIPRFTSNQETIVIAADQRMALIRSYQTGPRGRFTQQVLNDLAVAKLCLTNPAAKFAYDSMLEGLASATPPPPLAASSGRPTPLPPPPPTSHEASRQDPAAMVDDAESGWDEGGGFQVGSIVTGLAILVILAVGTYVAWQVVVARHSERAIATRTVREDGQAVDAGSGDVATVTVTRDEPVVVFQETDGSVHFAPPIAVLSSDTIRLETYGITDVLAGWTSVGDTATWNCKIIKLPRNAVFRVLVTYRATTEADGGTFELAINGRTKTCTVRGTGEFLTDEHFLAVTRTGDHALKLNAVELPGGTLEVRSIRLVMPTEMEQDSSDS